MRPDRVVIGADSDRAREVMRQLYRPLYLSETPMLFTDIETAELIKYAANAFLATKITFINEIADLCERVGADVQDVARGIGLDGRIGRKFLHAGPGFGGSCFPKDCQALVRTAREAEADLAIVETVVQVNEARKARMADKIIAACGGTVAGKTIAVLGLTFKPNTDDMRDSPSLAILPRLAAAGAAIRAFDPAGIDEAKKPDARPRLLRRRLRGDRRRRCAGAADRMERVPRPRPRPRRAAARRAAGHRSAQHLSAGRDGGRRALLCQHRPPAAPLARRLRALA